MQLEMGTRDYSGVLPSMYESLGSIPRHAYTHALSIRSLSSICGINIKEMTKNRILMIEVNQNYSVMLFSKQTEKFGIQGLKVGPSYFIFVISIQCTLPHQIPLCSLVSITNIYLVPCSSISPYLDYYFFHYPAHTPVTSQRHIYFESLLQIRLLEAFLTTEGKSRFLSTSYLPEILCEWGRKRGEKEKGKKKEKEGGSEKEIPTVCPLWIAQ